MEIKIREATPKDALAIVKVLHQTWLDTYLNEELKITRETIDESYKDSYKLENIEKLQERIKNIPNNQKRLVAESHGEIVAVSRGVIENDFNELKTIYVLPNFQGQGIGKKLWNEMLEFFDNSKKIVLSVVTYNKNAIEFYKKLGFVDTGKRFTDDKIAIKRGVNIPEMEMVLEK
jgi:diamine N-acetyltransferase